MNTTLHMIKIDTCHHGADITTTHIPWEGWAPKDACADRARRFRAAGIDITRHGHTVIAHPALNVCAHGEESCTTATTTEVLVFAAADDVARYEVTPIAFDGDTAAMTLPGIEDVWGLYARGDDDLADWIADIDHRTPRH